MLLQKTLKKGLYQLQLVLIIPKVINLQSNGISGFSKNSTTILNKFPNCTNLVMHVNKTNVSLWHERLGYPSERVMHSILNNMHIKANFS